MDQCRQVSLLLRPVQRRLSCHFSVKPDGEKQIEIGRSERLQETGIGPSDLMSVEIRIGVFPDLGEQRRLIDRADEFDPSVVFEMKLFLQPVVDSKTQKLVGAEALARIKDTNGQYIPPFMFIPIAEKNGRINLLGEQMFEKTCKFIKANNVKAMGLSWINVNLSPIQILRKDLNVHFSEILNNYDIPPEMIHLEITEESMIDFDLLESQMCKMKASGFVFVLDDYGRGYSNIARMKKCPFINVKLDMEFVWDFFKEKDKILPTLVQTIKQMGFTITAEGIETQEIADAMSDIGCDYLQGFVFSKPIPADEFAGIYGKN